MPEAIWTLAKLTPEQEQLLKEVEKTLGNGVILAFAKGTAAPSDLSPSQLQRLQELEQKLGAAVVAVRLQQRAAH